MKKLMVLAGGIVLALMGFGADVAPAGAVVGWWKFDDTANPGKDSGEYGNDIDGLSNVSAGVIDSSYKTRGTYDDSGCLYIGTAGNTATATPKKIWDTTKGYTYLMRIRSGVSISAVGDAQAQNLLNMISDKSGWHLFSLRYDPAKVTGGTNKYYYWLFGDDPTVVAADRSEVVSDSLDGVFFPLSTGISIGGKVGAKVKYGITFDKSVDYKGYIDDVVVVSRTMTKREVARYYLTADPNPYLVANSSTAFYQSAGWSCSDYESIGYAPSDLPGADFVIDNGLALTVAAEGAFGGHSLVLGHLAPLTSRLDGSQVASANGNLNQQASVTIPDLRLNNGKLTASAGMTLVATKLMVNAMEANPYEINVATGTYAVTGAASGGGWLKKTGAGTLDLTGLTGAAKVVVTEGKVLAGPNVTVTYDLEEDRGAVPVLMAE